MESDGSPAAEKQDKTQICSSFTNNIKNENQLRQHRVAGSTATLQVPGLILSLGYCLCRVLYVLSGSMWVSSQ